MSACPYPRKRQHRTGELAASHVMWLRRVKGMGNDVQAFRCGDHWHVGHARALLGYRARQARREGNA